MAELAKTEKMPIVDCDVHPLIKDINALMPYLSKSWQQHFKLGLERRRSDNGFIFARARDRYSHPIRHIALTRCRMPAVRRGPIRLSRFPITWSHTELPLRSCSRRSIMALPDLAIPRRLPCSNAPTTSI